MPGFICIGISTLDNFWFVPAIPSEPTKVFALSHTQTGGGMAANAAVAIAKLGGATEFWGRAGNDLAGRTMREMFAAEAINIEGYRLFDNAQSPVSAILVDQNGERLISTFRGSNLPDNAEWLPLHRLATSRVVLADMRWLDGALAGFREARNRDVITVLDADLAETENFDRLLPLTDHAVFSEPGLSQYAPGLSVDDALEKARSAGCSLAAVTLGSEGCRWLDANGYADCASFDIDVVDTTGAGDVFHGAYAYALGNNHEIADAMRFAAAAAAMKCRSAGGRAGSPTLGELTQFLADK